ncbi:MAG: secondary thiamine-phosphate synthase enzyme YjbQ [Phycisphaerales bacterium]|nr:secondary thiamine-phosphate synthase enzyme YjbQ [Phycisphaerales bacterium]
MTFSRSLQYETRGATQVIDIHRDVLHAVAESGVRSGICVVHVVGSTASITTTEAEPGLVKHDLKAFFERIAPEGGFYQHEATWDDDNGHAHVRASCVGPSVSLPIVDGRLAVGTWQQVVLIDFDTRPRQRQVIVQVVGER